MHARTSKTTAALVLVSISALLTTGCAMFDSLATKIPPESATAGTMRVMKQRILRYAATHDRLPSSTKDLPEIPGKVDSVKDAWGRDIEMTFTDRQATLTSLGRDGKPGGTGENADVSFGFPLKDKNGKWADEDVECIQIVRL